MAKELHPSPAPDLSSDEILGGTRGTPKGEARLKEVESAQAALDRADAVELFELYKTTIRDRAQMELALHKIVAHYVGEQKTPRFEPNENAIEAMEHVALAAIALAEKVATGGGHG